MGGGGRGRESYHYFGSAKMGCGNNLWGIARIMKIKKGGGGGERVNKHDYI